MGTAMSMNDRGRWIDEDAPKSERDLSVAMHLCMPLAIFFQVLLFAPLVVWLIKKEDSPFVDDHGRESVNFMISVLIYSVIAGALTIVLIGFPLLLVLAVLMAVGGIRGAMAANRGEFYRYPMTIRFLND